MVLKLPFFILIISWALSACTQNILGNASNSTISNTYAPGYAGDLAELNPGWTPQYISIVGYWRLDSDFTAVIGPNLTASGSGAAISNTTYKVGLGSASFDGASYAAAPLSSTYGFPNATFSVAGWMKITPACGELVTNGGGATNSGWFIGTLGPCVLGVGLKNSSGSGVTNNGSKVVSDGAWHHFAVVIHTDTTVLANNTIVLYVDGVNNSGATTATAVYTDPTNTESLALGARGVPVSPQAFVTGNIDEVAIWNVGLQATDVATIYNMQSPVFTKRNQLQNRQTYELAKSFFADAPTIFSEFVKYSKRN